MTPTFEYPAFVTVKAPTREDADALAQKIADNFEVYERPGVGASVSLDDGEPSIEDDE